MRGAGFSGGGGGELARPNTGGTGGRTVVDDPLKHVRDHISHAWVQHLALLRLVVINDVTVGIPYGPDHDWGNALAFISKNGISRGHVHGRGVIRSQGHGRGGADR